MIFEVKTLLGRKTHCTLVHFFGSQVELIPFKTRSALNLLSLISAQSFVYIICIISDLVEFLYVSVAKIMTIYSELLGALKQPYIRATEKGNKSAPIVHDV